MTTLTVLTVSYAPIYAQPQPKLGGITSQVAQNINQFQRFEIGKLSTGEKVLRVPREVMSQSSFREAIQRQIRNSATQIDRPINGVFLLDGSQMLFAGYDVESILDFKAGNQNYWVTRVRAQDGAGRLELSKPRFVNVKVVNINTSQYQFIDDFKKDNKVNGFFYASTRNGNGLNVEVVTYLVDLRIAVANPERNVVVCESSRYTQLRNGVSPTKNNPNCKPGNR
ncbi:MULTISPECIES: hypothetical protein [unclassified Microcoleus]|uniref:hypothetical protein n=1 Tax=unclassified Microcoleus TaxID=2642155 RepID=UPI0025FD0715|nr:MULTISPECIES: hypothetical protein [unclassified Microcoleus]